MTQETINWIAEGLPDSDTTVLVCVEGYGDNVGVGYHDGESWCWAWGYELPIVERVTNWAQLPEGPK